MAPKKGGSLIDGLWVGTGLYAASKARNFTGFLTSYAMYAVVVLVVVAVLGWVAKAVGLQLREKMTDIGAIQCQPGETETSDCYGERGCMQASGSCYKLNTPSGGPKA